MQTPKTQNALREFAIGEILARDLRQHIADTASDYNPLGLMFVNRNGKPIWMHDLVGQVLNPIFKKLGIWDKLEGRRAGLYAFRHMNMTEQSRRGVPPKTIQSCVGHSIGSDTAMIHYIHAVTADDYAAADMMDVLLTPKQESEAVQ